MKTHVCAFAFTDFDVQNGSVCVFLNMNQDKICVSVVFLKINLLFRVIYHWMHFHKMPKHGWNFGW